ncbi:YgaP family membrane protein [Halobellus rufus]|uniref:YgaP family membrane protein n=1 Tax=Halobellus rufus TaxID=1448860 RepID=UPI0006787579|nr:DUF2892 domain-containing protein [Halobellus rufus]
MERNVGQTDSLVRIASGAVAGLVSIGILANAVAAPPILSLLLGVIAIAMLATGVTGRCGLYSLIGVDTCGMR